MNKIRPEIVNVNGKQPVFFPFSTQTRNNETRHIELRETCKFKCRLDPSVCNNKQRWNKNKCRCVC